MTTVKETTDLCEIAKVKVGSVWTRHDSGEVVKIEGSKIFVKNNKGDEWNLTHPLVSSQFSFAEQFEEDIKVTRTEMIRILKDNRQTAMTVVYNKKPDGNIIAAALREGQVNLPDRTWLIKVNKLIAGDERTMIGHHFGVMDGFDRLQFHEHGKGPRKVDTRTVRELTVNQVRYTIK